MTAAAASTAGFFVVSLSIPMPSERAELADIEASAAAHAAILVD
jgi:hypothetical protein